MIFGLQNSKLVYQTTEYEFPKANMVPSYYEPDSIEKSSPFTGKKTFLQPGEYSSFTLIISNFKNSNPQSSFVTYLSLRSKLVEFYPHKEGQAVRDKQGNNSLFIIKSVRPFYKENDKYGFVEMTLASIGYTTLEGVYNILGFGYEFGFNFGFGV